LEGADSLTDQLKSYKARFEYYPESVHADTIYQNRSNKKYCKDLGIRLTGIPLGKPKKQTGSNKAELDAEKSQRRQDELGPILAKGKFDNMTRKGTLPIFDHRLRV